MTLIIAMVISMIINNGSKTKDVRGTCYNSNSNNNAWSRVINNKGEMCSGGY